MFFALLLSLYFIEQAALAAFFAVSLPGCKESRFAQILQRSANGRLRQLEFRCNGRDRRPALVVLIRPVQKVDINGYCPMGQLHAV